MLSFRFPVCLTFVVLALTACDSSPHPLLQRRIGPRTSLGERFVPCQWIGVEKAPIPHFNCPSLTDSVNHADAARVNNPSMPWQAATWDINWSHQSAEPGKVRDRSISILHEHVRTASDPLLPRLDLAAAHIQRAADENRWMDLLDALEILLDTSRVGTAKPELFRAWQYNTVLALTMLGLSCDRSYCSGGVAARSADPWLRELAAVSAQDQTAPSYSRKSNVDSIARSTRRWPASSVDWLYRIKLQELASVSRAGDSNARKIALQEATVVADSLAAAAADSSMRQLVTEAARDRMVAEIIPLVSELRDSASVGQWSYVITHLPQLDVVSKRSHAVRRITRFWSAAGAALASNDLLPLDSVSWQESRIAPEIAGRAALFAGTLAARSLQLGDEEHFLARAEHSLAIAGRRELGASVTNTRAEREMLRGDRITGGLALLKSLHALRTYPDSRWRHNALWVLAREAWSGGWPLVAEYVVREDLRTAASKPGSSRCEAMVALARVHGVKGDAANANKLLSGVREQLSACGPSDAQEWFQDEIGSVVAALESGRATDAGLVAFVNTLSRRGRSSRTVQPLRQLADTYLSTGEYGKIEVVARAQLLNLQRQLNGVSDPGARRRIIARAEEELEPLEIAMLRSKKTDGVIALVDQFRKLRAGDTTSSPQPEVAYQAVRYLLVRDSLVIVSERGANRTVLVTPINRAALDTHRTRVANRNTDEASLAWLYRELIRPVISSLDSGRMLALDLPSELLAIPFAALRANKAAPFLVEQFDLLHVGMHTSNGAPVEPRQSSSKRLTKAVVVLSDSGVGSSFAPWPALPSASMEADQVAAQLATRKGMRVVSLMRRKATIEAMLRELSDASVLHFAGHALGDPVRPEAAALLTGVGDNATHFSAQHLSKLAGSRLQLVVLSACESARPGASGSDAFGSLAQAFADAGARHVIGATWAVDDEATAALMSEFYESYANGNAPVRALADAQRAMVRHDDHRFRAPAHWAGFRIAGNN